MPTGRPLPLWIGAEGFAIGHEELALEAPETWVEVVLTTPARVAGSVRDASGNPLAEVEITARAIGAPPLPSSLDAPQWAERRTWTAKSGAFELDRLPATTVELVAELRGTGEVRETVELVAGQALTWNPVLVPAGSIAGVVIDENGAVPGIMVSASAGEGEERQNLGEVLTDTDGAFRLSGASRSSYTLCVRDPSAAVDTALLVEGVTPGSEDLEIVYPSAKRASARIIGRLSDADGSPYEAENVHVEREHAVSPVGGSVSSRCVGGRLETGLLPPGRYLVTLARSDRVRWMIGPFELHAGETYDFGDLVCPSPGRLEVALRDTSGAAVPSARVRVHSSDGPSGSLVDIRDGTGACELLPGSYWISPWGSDMPLTRTRVEVRSGETAHATLALPAAFPRWIRYPHAPEALRDLRLEWRCDGTVLSSGPWRIGDGAQPNEYQLAAGHYEVVLTLADGRSATTEFEVSASTTGKEQAVELRWP